MTLVVSVLRWARRGMYLGGPICLYLWTRPASFAEARAVVADWLPDAINAPLVWAAFATAGVARLGAAWLDRRPIRVGSSIEGKVNSPTRATPNAVDGSGRTRKSGKSGKGKTERHLLAPLKKDAGVVVFVDRLLSLAMSRRASDIHLQPLAGVTRVSLRIAGVLEDVAEPAARFHEGIVRRLKVMSDLVTYQTTSPQDGVLRVFSPEGEAEMRISVLPTKHGEKIVLRWVKTGAELRRLDELGFSTEAGILVRELLGRPQGLIAVTGPTGSGKTSTLYAALAAIHEDRGATTQIATIEDPIEVELPFLSQTQVRPDGGVAFAEGLKAVLRQDPNVLMVGEIRDPESARIAVRAGLSGHLVLTTIHAESSAGVFGRLIEMGVEPFLVASSMLAALSQRLVVLLCRGCRVPAKVSADQRRRLVELGMASDARMWTAPGCHQCRGTGSGGRRAAFEVLSVTSDLRQVIARRVSTAEIEERIATSQAMRVGSIREELKRLASEGSISVDELLRLVAPAK